MAEWISGGNLRTATGGALWPHPCLVYLSLFLSVSICALSFLVLNIASFICHFYLLKSPFLFPFIFNSSLLSSSGAPQRTGSGPLAPREFEASQFKCKIICLPISIPNLGARRGLRNGLLIYFCWIGAASFDYRGRSRAQLFGPGNVPQYQYTSSKREVESLSLQKTMWAALPGRGGPLG